MDTDKVLLAIEEKKKWEERATGVEAALEKLKERNAILSAELKAVQEKLRYYSALAESFREHSIARASGVYYVEGTRQFR